MQSQKNLFGETISKEKIPNRYGCSGKVTFKPYSQDQEFLLPKRLSDFVEAGHIACLISSIIDQMDTSFILKTYKGGGTSSYDPKMMLKVWILGFVSRIYSSRLLAKALRESLPFIWISGNQTPDFRTLNDFRLRLKEDIKKIFKKIVVYALEQGIIEGKDVFVDHSKTIANANKNKIVWKKQVEKQLQKIDAELDEFFSYIDELNELEDRNFGKKDLPEKERSGFDDTAVKKLVEKINKDFNEKKISRETAKAERKKVRRTKQLLDRKKQYKQKKDTLASRNSYSKTDIDAVAMMQKDKLTIRPAYNEGIAVENGIVLDYTISNNACDSVSFTDLMQGTVDNLNGKTPETTTGDGAYGTEENMNYLDTNNIGNYLKHNTFHREKKRSWKDKRPLLEDLKYNAEKDEFDCDCGAKLVLEKELEETTATGYCRKMKRYKTIKEHTPDCPVQKKRKTKNGMLTLDVSWNAERLKKQARENLNSPKGLELRKRRGNEVESVFGDEKMNRNKRRYHLRGLQKVLLEAGLYYIAHNLRKIHKHNQQAGTVMLQTPKIDPKSQTALSKTAFQLKTRNADDILNVHSVLVRKTVDHQPENLLEISDFRSLLPYRWPEFLDGSHRFLSKTIAF